MNIINALEAKNQFGHLLDSAQSNPVQINKHGRPVAYIISTAEYTRLNKFQESTMEKAILKANQEEAGDKNYQKELSFWDATLSDGIVGAVKKRRKNV
jgi:prevent-host-death family protein